MYFPANLPYFHNYLLSDDYVLSHQWILYLNFKNSQRYIMSKRNTYILRKLERAYSSAGPLWDRCRAGRDPISEELRIRLKYKQ